MSLFAQPRALRSLAALLPSLLLFACAPPQGAAEAPASGGQASASGPQAGEPVRLTLAAAASLREVATALADAYQAQHPGTQVRVTAAGSGALLEQLKAGAPADLFLSADTQTMQQAQAAGLLQGQARPLVYNRLVLIAPQGQPVQSASGQPLALPATPEQAGAWLGAQVNAGARIALGKPQSVPAGRYAKAALQGLNLWAEVQPRLVYGQNVKQVLDWVARGEAQAGFVYATDAAQMPQQVQVVATLPLKTPVEYQAAQLRAAPQPQAAAELLDFLGSPQAQDLFRKAGFLTHPPQ